MMNFHQKNKLKKLLPFFLSIFLSSVQLIVLMMNGCDLLASFFLVVPLFSLRYLIFSKFENFINSMTLFVIVLYYEIAFSFSPIVSYFFGKKNYDLETVLVTNLSLVLVYVVGYLCFEYLNSMKQKASAPGVSLRYNRVFLVSFFLLSVLFSLFLKFFNIGVMGSEPVLLPYRLEPALNLTRTIIIPCFFTFFTFLNLHTYKKVLLPFSLLVVWAIVESYCRGSRGVLFLSSVPMLLLILRFIELKRVVFVVTLILGLGFGSFVAGSFFRSCHLGQCENNLNSLSSLNSIYQRVFNEHGILKKIKQAQTNNKINLNPNFYFSHKGGTNIHTKIIDAGKWGVNHSSGITAFTDGFLVAGSLGALVSIFVLLLSSTTIEVIIIRYSLPPYVGALFGWYLFERTFWGEGLWSFFLFRSPLTIAVFPLTLLLLIFIHKRIEISEKISNEI